MVSRILFHQPYYFFFISCLFLDIKRLQQDTLPSHLLGHERGFWNGLGVGVGICSERSCLFGITSASVCIKKAKTFLPESFKNLRVKWSSCGFHLAMFRFINNDSSDSFWCSMLNVGDVYFYVEIVDSFINLLKR